MDTGRENRTDIRDQRHAMFSSPLMIRRCYDTIDVSCRCHYFAIAIRACFMPTPAAIDAICHTHLRVRYVYADAIRLRFASLRADAKIAAISRHFDVAASFTPILLIIAITISPLRFASYAIRCRCRYDVLTARVMLLCCRQAYERRGSGKEASALCVMIR